MLVGTQVLGATGVGLAAVTPLVAAAMTDSPVVAGLAQTGTVVGAAVFALPVAALAARRGRRPALLFGYGAGAVGAALAVAAVTTGSWPGLVGAMVLFGGGLAANLAARYAAADLAPPAQRARAVATLLWVVTVGAVAGPNLAGPADALAAALGLTEGTGPFLAAAVVFAAAAVGVLAGLRPDPLDLASTAGHADQPVHHPVPPAAHDHLQPGPPVRVRRAGVWRRLDATGRLALAGVATSHLAMVGLMSMTPVHMGHGSASLTVVGVVVSVHVAAMYAASPLFGWMADRLGRVPVLAVGAALVVAGASISGMAPATDAPQLAAGLTVLGFGWSAALVAGSALLTESVPAQLRPAAQGLADLCMNIGGVLGGVLAGAVVTVWSYGALGLVVGFSALPLLVMCMAANPRPAG
ncbi:putative arabinose efflux permease, MFS family [Goodfellowiella coeruleoviolacea]|uniref:Arabinose efflux permease, MFS family n=1 Tax=Goodfellowiella coeruleoviolacea TaxID=334858 RepID=A0AAE3GBU6_9PSEU|nr:putative arabinose efflux permease, MFS family [Goodfellowiella coeruleoviolacea]